MTIWLQVSICAGANTVRPWAAMVIGVIGGLGLLLSQWAVLAIKVDDPLDATSGTRESGFYHHHHHQSGQLS